ncbi:TolC family protein [Bacteroidota bacterium]
MKIITTYMLMVCLLVISMLTTTHAQEQDPLDKYLIIGAENNNELQSLFMRYHAALERIPQAKSLPDPLVMFNIFVSPIETRIGAQRAGISLNQAFPWFGQLKSQEQVSINRAKAIYEGFRDAKNKLFFEIKSTYYDAYFLEAAITITEENITLIESFSELANIKLESGRGSAVDLIRIDMDLAELNNQLSLLIDSREPLHSRFNELLNTDSIKSIDFPDTLMNATLEDSREVLYDSILQNNPSLARIEYDILSYESGIQAAEKMGLPSFNLGLSYTFISPRNDIDVPDNGKDAIIFPSIGVRLPLYRKKYQAMVKEQGYLKSGKLEEKEARGERLLTALEKTWRDYRDATRRIGLYQNLSTLANQSLEILVTEYTTAGQDFEELLRMDRQLLRYELELEKAKADQHIQFAYINYLTGK